MPKGGKRYSGRPPAKRSAAGRTTFNKASREEVRDAVSGEVQHQDYDLKAMEILQNVFPRMIATESNSGIVRFIGNPESVPMGSSTGMHPFDFALHVANTGEYADQQQQFAVLLAMQEVDLIEMVDPDLDFTGAGFIHS